MNQARSFLPLVLIFLVLASATQAPLLFAAGPLSIAALCAGLTVAVGHCTSARYCLLAALCGSLLLWLGAVVQLPSGASSAWSLGAAAFIGVGLGWSEGLGRGRVRPALFGVNAAIRDVALVVGFTVIWAGLIYAQQPSIAAEPAKLFLIALSLSLMQLLALAQVRNLENEPQTNALGAWQLPLAALIGIGLAKFPALLGSLLNPSMALLATPLAFAVAVLGLRAATTRSTLGVWGLFAPSILIPPLLASPSAHLLPFVITMAVIHLIMLRFGDRLLYRGPSEDSLVNTLQIVSQCGHVHVDLMRRDMLFSPAALKLLGGTTRQPFAARLVTASPAEVLDFLSHVKSGEPGTFAPSTLTLKQADGELALFRIYLISRSESGADVLLCGQHIRESEARQNLAMRDELARLHLREERLLSIASHELRTPAAALAMLIEDLQAGEPWEEIGPQMERTVTELFSVLEDLRATGSGAHSGVRNRLTRFRPVEIASWLRQDYEPSAKGAGLSFQISLPEQAELLLDGDLGRMMLALERLLRFLLQGRGPGALRLSLMVAEGKRQQGTFTASATGNAPLLLVWEISADYEGATPHIGPELFEPFAQSGQIGEDRGLGLFTALKAAESMGGSLSYAHQSNGLRFTLSHPATPLNDPEVKKLPPDRELA